MSDKTHPGKLFPHAASLWPRVTIVCICTAIASTAVAQATSSTLYLKFLDSTSGAAVAPNSLIVDGAKTTFQIEAGSLTALSLDDGSHVINVDADKYQPIEFVASVAGADTAVMEVELDALEPATPAPVDAGSATIEGYVTDADTGALLDKVTLTLPDSSITTTTDPTGHYMFMIKVPAVTADSKPVIAMNVRAETYQPLKMKNLALAPGERRNMPIKLSHLAPDADPTAEELIDEAAPDGPLRSYDWVFDVSLR